MSSPTLETSDANCPVGGVFKIREILYWDSLRAKPFNLRVEVTELIPHFLSPSWFFILLGDSRSAPSSWQMAGGFSRQTSRKGGLFSSTVRSYRSRVLYGNGVSTYFLMQFYVSILQVTIWLNLWWKFWLKEDREFICLIANLFARSRIYLLSLGFFP